MKGVKDPELRKLGSFDLGVLKDLLPVLEAHAIPFETGGDTVLGRQAMRVYGNPPGPTVDVMVPANKFTEAASVVTNLYPIQS
jgi:hypothetical protein